MFRLACERAGAALQLERRIRCPQLHPLFDLGAQEPLHVVLSPGLLGHDPAKLSDTDVPVAVDIRRVNQLLQFGLFHVGAECGHPHLQLFLRDQAVTIIIKLLEGRVQLTRLLDLQCWFLVGDWRQFERLFFLRLRLFVFFWLYCAELRRLPLILLSFLNLQFVRGLPLLEALLLVW